MLRVPILLHGLQPSLLLLIVSQSYLLENSLFCSSVQQLGQLASKDELRSEEAATVHAEEVETVDVEAEDKLPHTAMRMIHFQFQFPFFLACLLLSALSF
jgi:hypothetical protein